ncbi:peptide deformylase [Sulfurihydrogenibium azorense]|uniref:peptide deformylase n=1 Tax=Sulfurihydrogenibium azorense TaxID=309806 RepID=UPI002409A7E9|nr:peptide deformylase [Sulfurihydrogenibium azorense]MDM7273826.1 peptide deformylase [Sulfurihydrogenibium azorense]
MEYRIRTWPDKILKEPTKEVDFFNDRLKEYIDKMWEFMYKEEGVGLAANQIGIPYQILVIDTSIREKKNEEETEPPVKMVLINPKIVEKEGQVMSTEGCLSFPGVQITIPRYKRVKVVGKNEKGEDVVVESSEFLSIVLQHEIDHLNGIPFISYLSPLKRKLVLDKYLKSLKESEYQTG